MAKNKKGKKGRLRRFLKIKIIAGAGLIIVSMLLAVSLFANVSYGERIYPRVEVAGLELSGKTKNEALELITQRAEEYLASKPVFKLVNGNRTWQPTIKDLGAELDVEKTVDQAFSIGHQENFLMAAARQIQSWISPIKVDLAINFDPDKLAVSLKPLQAKLEKPYQNDSYKFEDLTLVEVSASEGLAIDQDRLKDDLRAEITRWGAGQIKIEVRKTYPKVRRENALAAKEQAEKMVAFPITLKYQDKKYVINQNQLASLIVFSEKQIDDTEVNPFDPNVADHFRLEAELSDKAIKEYSRSLADEVNTLPVNARIQFVNGKLRILTKSKPGTFLDEKSLIADLREVVKIDGERVVTIKINKLASDINEKNLSKLGIKELISRGISDFSGSPSNRRHNIAIGASMFNGVIIKPGDVFSFTSTLGSVSAKTGYLPELVIKEDRTIPEYGGGLCQVSTTAFRAAVLAGLPILERQPHSYRVKYYDWPYGPGFDSTVYIPHPDLQFKNDTSAHILIQTYVSGNRLTFEFYGTRGKRSVKINGPRVLTYLSGGALKAEFYQLVYEGKKLIRRVRFYSFYDRPDKYHQDKPKPTPAPKPTATKKPAPKPAPLPEPPPPEPTPTP